MSDDNKTIGNLYFNDYKKEGEKKPDYTGSLEISSQQIRDLIKAGKAGEKVELKLGSWEYPSKKDANQSRFFIVAESGSFKSQQEKTDDWNSEDDPF